MTRYRTLIVDPPWPMPDTGKTTRGETDSKGVYTAKGGRVVDIILHRIAQGGLLRAQDEPAYTNHDQEQDDVWTAVDVAELLNGWEHEAELGYCAAHGIRRCTICLGEDGR